MDKIPQDRDARLAYLEGWAKLQQSLLASEEQRRLYGEGIARVVAEARQRAGQADSVPEVAVIPVVVTKPPDLPPDRAAVFADLMDSLREYEWADPVVSECDEPAYIAPRAIELARKHRPGTPWLLYMEDDVILGPDFGLLPGLLKEADELFPHTGLVSFYCGPIIEPGWTVHPMDEFNWLQCAAIRSTDHLLDFRAFIDGLVIQSADQPPSAPRPLQYEFPDAAVAAFLAVEYDAYALWCPGLVQHADVTSAFFGEQMGRRVSWSYDQAYANHHKLQAVTTRPPRGR